MKLILLILILFTGVARATFLPKLDAAISSPGEDDGYFVSPNELTPGDAIPILKLAPPGGIYLAVGTERGFIGFALTSADKLLLFDRDPFAVWFNRINIALLAASHDRQDYLHLRRATDSATLRTRVGAEFDEATLEWFLNEQTKSQPLDGFRRLLANDSPEKSFANANYLHDETFFKRLRSAAKNGSIQSIQLDVTRRAAFRRLVAHIKDAGLFVSIADFSNMGLNASVGPFGTLQALHDLQSVTAPQSLLLVTGNRRPKSSKAKGEWEYFGATFEYLLSGDNLAHFKSVQRLMEDSDSGRGAGKTRTACGSLL